MKESDIQKTFMQWLQVKHPDLYAVTYSTPNEGKRSWQLGKHMKAMGLKSGVPDLCIAFPTKYFHGLYIELKTEKGKPTANQCEWIEKLNSRGYLAVVCKGLDAAIDRVELYIAG